uniref:Bestrophin homolog n=1 Tax=Panagrolaimus sp. PS1159 TaxID=55785 RepID=A0AC35GQ22_9BILA
MTVSYSLDSSYSSFWNVTKVFFRWKGSLWKAVLFQLLCWCFGFACVTVLYRMILSEPQQVIFERIANYLAHDIYQIIPLTFMLGFFVSFVVSRWLAVLNGIGWIDNSAMVFSVFIDENSEKTRLLRRTLVRHMVLTQILVLRDISLQVRKRFPTMETVIEAGFLTKNEQESIEAVDDQYSRYWVPLKWVYQHVREARKENIISSDTFYNRITLEVQIFQQGLANLLKYDWVPVPLIYPQLISLSVRIYFLLCLMSRQFLKDSPIDIWVPILTMIQFIVYFGWMKVGEVLLNPLGDDDDDIECNHIIDRNLITGFKLVESTDTPEMEKDIWWNKNQIVPLYTVKSAERSFSPL